ncbi:MAG TPA: cupin domain-containing protein [Flavitalea sp.]|nr:cupin domain-containing protein [Flavitalea sp.]
MRKIIPLALGCLAFITVLAQHVSLASINDNPVENATTGKRQTANGCAPSPHTAHTVMSGPHIADGSTASKGDFNISTFLSDAELSKFKFESRIFELGPGQSDTISHRHDCDVFVTVLEGTALIGQEFKKPDTVKTGEIFHERRNVIHSISINPSQDKPMKAFVVFIRKDGRAGYTPLYPKNK